MDNLFVQRKKKKHLFGIVLLSILTVVILLITIFNMLISAHVGIHQVSVTINSLPSRLEGFKILVLSDLHGASFGVNQQELLSAVNSQKYHVICILGDVCDAKGSVRPLIRLIEQLEGNQPVLFIPGDEDPAPVSVDALPSGSIKADYIRQLEEAGIVYLDAPYCIEMNGKKIWFTPESVYSLDLASLEKSITDRINELKDQEDSRSRNEYLYAAEYQLDRIDRIRNSQKTMTRDDIHIALTHVPLSENAIRDLHDLYYNTNNIYIQGVSLILAGHYNAGQWRLPWGTVFYIPDSFNNEAKGFFVSDKGVVGASSVVGLTQYITPGLSVSNVYPSLVAKFRLFNQPMISIVTLTGKIVN